MCTGDAAKAQAAIDYLAEIVWRCEFQLTISGVGTWQSGTLRTPRYRTGIHRVIRDGDKERLTQDLAAVEKIIGARKELSELAGIAGKTVEEFSASEIGRPKAVALEELLRQAHEYKEPQHKLESLQLLHETWKQRPSPYLRPGSVPEEIWGHPDPDTFAVVLDWFGNWVFAPNGLARAARTIRTRLLVEALEKRKPPSPSSTLCRLLDHHLPGRAKGVLGAVGLATEQLLSQPAQLELGRVLLEHFRFGFGTTAWTKPQPPHY